MTTVINTETMTASIVLAIIADRGSVSPDWAAPVEVGLVVRIEVSTDIGNEDVLYL